MGVDLTGLGAAFDFGSKILDKIFPDPAKKAEAQLGLLQLQQSGQLAQLAADSAAMQGQVDIAKIEAASPSLFIAGPRPAMMWCCVAIFACNYIGVPFLAWLSPVLNIPPPPRLDIGEVLPVLTGMLGLGVMRMGEKIKGVA